MRIAFGGFEHETNSFSSTPITAEAIRAARKDGQALIDSGRGVRSTTGGLIDECAELGIELIPATRVNITPCAPAIREAYEAFRDDLAERLWAIHQKTPLDAIALNIHGAGVAEGYPDMEYDLLRAVRAKFGREMLIGLVLDLHGNLSQEMMDLCDTTVGFKSYPHVDTYESARLLVRLLHEQIAGKKRLHQALVRLPWHIAPGFGVTLSGPAHDIAEFDRKLVEDHPDLRDVSFFHGFPYADVAICGASVTAVAETPEAARLYAEQAADYAWSRRRDFEQPLHSAEEAMDLAEQAEAPVVINESSDNPGGGGPGDGTGLLREMLKWDLPGTVFGNLYDPEVARMAADAGVGSRIDCLLGAKTDTLHGTPIQLKGALVKAVSDGVFTQTNPMGAGSTVRLGTTVLLQCGNVGIVVTCGRRQTLDDGPFRIVGIDWQEMRILALKSSQHFKGWWYGRAKTIIPCDSPGIHSSDLRSFAFRNLDMRYFPFGDPVR